MAQTMAMPDIWINEITSPDSVFEFWKWLTRDGQGREFIACDTETTGLDPFEPGFHVRLIQFGDEESGWAIPFQDWKGLIFGALRWLEEHRIKIIWHNLAFDAQALSVSGYQLDMSLQEDTFIWATLGGHAEDSRALKPTGARELGQWVLFGQGLLKSGMSNAGWGWHNVPLNWKPFSAYGVIDTVVTAMLRQKWADRRSLYGWHHSLEIATIETTNMMERNAFAVDTEYCLSTIAQLEAKRLDIEAQLKTFGVESAGQNAVVAKVLQEAGVLPELLKMTDSGQISMDKHVLSVIDHPVARLVLQYRGLNKTEGYLHAMIKAAYGVIGTRELAHANIRSVEAKTGRMSVARPALQQMPKAEKDPTVRNAVVPREEGHVLIGADFGQIELRMFAAMTRDQALLDVLNKLDAAKAAGDKSADFFVLLGQDLYDPHFQKSDPRRNMLKTTIYAKLYAGGEDTIAAAAKTDPQTISTVIKTLESRYPSFATLGNELIEQRSGGTFHVSTPTGRPFSVHTSGERRKLMNYLVQGHSAEVLKMALVNSVEAGLGEYFVLPVHDELILSVPEKMKDEATHELVECMNAVVDPGVYGVKVSASPANPAQRWGDMDH